ncbi:thiol reductant ABC exporter subunit CydC [Staphylococcus kloosii]|jgi:ATP-binding cassette subfamily C protein CydC|uniref:Thiol reductant ABC exporter subunit CydC n=1 Tax=Staphylococcus kloosii TaxID=29384 RepID=A0ABQ0XNL3_9STAP|nr:thiol reductant ABC exporter subunit CydC [Staphylococcus kloosii]AVQ36858.1 thiol reductant ABC exporter subunit CydC [Staphylococcus kloosii]PNZ06968.1 thiol reductant ABC exporter subunit CydC [Staphylococcus kloosii]GEP83018.1 thiol reductant ABC exporter subunit CydC [Staphylococcus kloosii]SUM49958.1 ABC transporter ATPase [Staphylococcus kloosii]
MKPRIHFKIDKDLILAVAVGVLGSLVALAMFFLSGYMVTQSALGAPLFALMVLIVSVKMFGFLRAIFRYIERLLSHRTTFTMLRNVRVQFFKGLIPVVPDIYRKFKSTELLSNMIGRIEALQNIYLRVYYPPIVIGLTSIVSVIVLFVFSYVHAAVIFISMLITLGIVPWISAKRARKIKQIKRASEKDFMDHYYDYKAGYDELNRFSKVDDYKDKVQHALKNYSQAQDKEQQFLTRYDFLLNLIAMVALFFTLLLGVLQVQKGSMDVVYLTSIVLMMLTLFEQAVPMSNVAYFKADTDDALDSVNNIMAHPVEQGNENLITKTVSNKPILKFNNVTFKYWQQHLPVVNNINLQINKGSHVAIVGPSGSGKSTLLNLMLGLYETTKGNIAYRGQDIHHIKNEQKYASINALLQSQQMFDGSLRDNLFTQRSDDEIRKVLDLVGLSDMPLDKELDLSGNNVSGGELQRISIARLLLKESDLWIMDEPTTALDIYNTDKIMSLIHDYAETLVVATHDLRLLPYFDEIIVMVEGEIIERGSYDKLITQRGYLYDVLKLNDAQ